MEKDNTLMEQFYQDVSDLLGIENKYSYDAITHGGLYRTRWNNRAPGNGRFEGYGIIRYFSDTCIHLAINKPVSAHGIFTSKQEVLDFLHKSIDSAVATK
jgi:hypothetical protein